MKTLPLHPEILQYLDSHNIKRILNKKLEIFLNNPFHPSLKTERLEPRAMKIWSFRINSKYRAIFIFLDHESVEIIDINNHYK